MFKLGIKTTIAFIIIVLIGLSFCFLTLYKNNFNITGSKTYIYIPTGSNYNDLLRQLENKNLLKNKTSFLISAKLLGLENNIKAGRYLIDSLLTNKDLINDIKNSKQALVKISLDNIRTLDQLAKILSEKLEIQYNKAQEVLKDTNIASSYGFTSDQFMSLFIADTYFFNWNTSIKQFLNLMEEQNKKIWNANRLNKAKSMHKSPAQVYTLASIVYKETSKIDEMPTVAGLYINRLKRNMPLASDPTVIFANNDFSIKRVRFKHLKNASPYNTYKYKGLPPGPISTVPVTAIDAVLNYAKHNYLYMSAKADLSGYHNFSTNFRQHKKNAEAIRKKFNKLKIK